MIRSFAVASLTIIVVVLFGARDYISAQSQPSRVNNAVPIQFTGAAPGASLELFMNAGKVASVTIDSTGQGASVLDLSNLGKAQMQVYVDVCQDGKIVKVHVVSGQPPPGDDNCKRRILAGAWRTDCGVTSIAIDFTKSRVQAAGCGNFFTSKMGVITTAAAIVGGASIASGVGGGTGAAATTIGATTTAIATAPPAPVAPPTVPVSPPVADPVVPVAPVTPSNPVDFVFLIVPDYFHNGNTSVVCYFLKATAVGNAPAVNSSATYTGTITGPGVISGGTVAGSLNAAGEATPQAAIDSYGPYTGNFDVQFGGIHKQMTAQMTVNPAQGRGCTTPK